jgi:hypothetical protein
LYQYSTGIVSDGAGGAIITWEDWRSGNPDIYAQRVDASGDTIWTADGVALCTASGNQNDSKIVSDGASGAIVTWKDTRSGNSDIYAQHVNAAGAAQWTADGVALCTATGNQFSPAIGSDGAGGAVITWYDLRAGSNYDVYAQNVNSTGAVQWTADGIEICTATGNQRSPMIISDGSGGAIVTWYDNRSGNDDIYVQRVNASGTVLWAADGVALCTASGNQSGPTITYDGAGGAIVTWHDYRSGNYDIYAQLVGAAGRTGEYPPDIIEVADVAGDQGGRITIAWRRSGMDVSPVTVITHYSVWRSLSAEAAASLRALETWREPDGAATPRHSGPVYRETSAAGVSYAWEWLADLPSHYFDEYSYTAESLHDSSGVTAGYQHFLVSAHTSDPFVFYDSLPDSGYSVDNLAPAAPVALAAQYTGGSDLYLHWNPNTEADLHSYAVYRGSSPDFVPDELTRIGTTTDSSFVDTGFGYGEYYYKVSAIDVHENESPFSLLTPEMITGAPGGRTHYDNVLFQNAPNPFLSSTRIAFSLKEAGHLRLSVFDAKGRLVRVLVDEVRRSNHYVESWDGRDRSGRAVPAGMYFYSLEAPGWKSSKKMTLAR